MAFNWHRKHTERLTVGERAADILRNAMGSWAFVFSFLGFMLMWMGLNLWGTIARWDAYPFILLNLMLSTLAGLQGAILLIAAKRQDQISAALAQHDYDTNVHAEREIADNNRMTEEIHRLTTEIYGIIKGENASVLREDR